MEIDRNYIQNKKPRKDYSGIKFGFWTTVKLFFLAMFLGLACYAAEPKFKFNDCVKVTKGFYLDCYGHVTGYLDLGDLRKNMYTVDSENCRGGRPFSADFVEKDLEACKGTSK